MLISFLSCSRFSLSTDSFNCLLMRSNSCSVSYLSFCFTFESTWFLLSLTLLVDFFSSSIYSTSLLFSTLSLFSSFLWMFTSCCRNFICDSISLTYLPSSAPTTFAPFFWPFGTIFVVVVECLDILLKLLVSSLNRCFCSKLASKVKADFLILVLCLPMICCWIFLVLPCFLSRL